MTRREGEPTFGRRYLGNTHKMEVHDLDSEKTGPHQCQIDEIIAAHNRDRNKNRRGRIKIFEPDTLDQARREGFDNCEHCIGDSIQ
jgi:hypothetical protein